MHKTEREPKLKGMTMMAGALESLQFPTEAERMLSWVIHVGSMLVAFEEPTALKLTEH